MLVSPGLPPERGECVARERSRSPPALLLARAVSALFAVARTTARDARGRGGSLRVSESDVSVTVISVVSREHSTAIPFVWRHPTIYLASPHRR